MATNENISLKWNHKGTFRRFQVPRTGDLFATLMSKITAVVPDFNGKLAWKDEDGDQIVFTTNVELVEAVSLPINQQILRIFTIENAGQEEEPKKEDESTKKERHFGVTCDSCDGSVWGIRYKCAVCDDFDLCETCEKKGLHAEHPLIRYATPRTQFLDDFMRRRRHCRRFGHGSFSHGTTRGGPFSAEGLFGAHGRRDPAAAAADAAKQAAKFASEQAAHVAQHAANVAASFAQQNANGAENAATESSQQIRDSVAQGMEFLKEVGLQVQQALSNFGIETDIDVQHGGFTERVPKAAEKTEEEKQKENGEKDAEKRKSDDSTEKTGGEKDDVEEVRVPMKKMHISESATEIPAANAVLVPTAPAELENTPILVDVESVESPESEVLVDIHGDGDNDAWTVMDSNDNIDTPPVVPSPTLEPETPTVIPNTTQTPIYPQLPSGEVSICQAGTPFLLPPPGPHNRHCNFIHPSGEIARCVEKLEEMGYDNCNGWLTKLSSHLDGNIIAVIEAMASDPMYAQRLRQA